MSGLLTRFLNLDRFGEPVSVNYQGDGSYKTYGGACLSFFTYVLVLAFAVVQAGQLLSRSNPNISETIEFVNYAHSNDIVNLEE